MISYAGTVLAECRPDLAARIQVNIDHKDVYEFSDLAWPGQNRQRWSHQGKVASPPIKINSLYWPRGASQFAVAHVLANDEMLATIKGTVYSGGELVEAALVMSDGTNSITTGMFMLPPRPLAQIETTNPIYRQLYLVTLVDDRYFWWYKSDDLSAEESWDGLYSSAASALGISFTNDTIDGAYLSPSKSMAQEYPYLPLLLDAVAYNVGQRIVRKLDGSVVAQSYETAKSSLEAQLALGYSTHAGGLLSEEDKAAMVPQETLVVFPQMDTEQWCAAYGDKDMQLPTGAGYFAGNTLSGLGMAAYSGVVGFGTSKTWHNQATRTSDNTTEIDALAAKFSEDWYNWQSGSMDKVFTGIIPWEPEGLHQSVEWFIESIPTGFRKVGTRIQRPPWNDLADRLNHKSSKGTIDATDRAAMVVDAVDTMDEEVPMTGDVFFVDKSIVRDSVVENMTVSNLTVSCGIDMPPCEGVFYVVVYDVRCEDGDLNRYAIYYEIGYLDGCLQIVSTSEFFTNRIMSCRTCTGSIYSYAYDVRCENGTLNKYLLRFKYTYNQYGCLQLASATYEFYGCLATGVTCCSSSSSSSSSGSSSGSSSSSSDCVRPTCGTTTWESNGIDWVVVSSDCECTSASDCCPNYCMPMAVTLQIISPTGIFACLRQSQAGQTSFSLSWNEANSRYQSAAIAVDCVGATCAEVLWRLVCGGDGIWRAFLVDSSSGLDVCDFCFGCGPDLFLCDPLYLILHMAESSPPYDCLVTTAGEDCCGITQSDTGTYLEITSTSGTAVPVTPPYSPALHTGETVVTDCACCGTVTWFWNGVSWDQVDNNCTSGATAVQPTPNADAYPYVTTACLCPCEESSSSGASNSSSSSSAAEQEYCCNCAEYPLAWSVTIADMDGTCLTIGACAALNGTHTLNSVGSCHWRASIHGTVAFDLQCDDTDYILLMSVPGSACFAYYKKSRASWATTGCLSEQTMTLDSSVMTGCTGVPATITLTPA